MKEVFTVNLFKILIFIVFGGQLFSGLCFGGEVPVSDFWICRSERARGVSVRSLRIHEFQNGKHCLVIYTIQGKEEILAEDKWLSSCQKALQNKKTALLNNLWSCERQPLVYVFYPEKALRSSH